MDNKNLADEILLEIADKIENTDINSICDIEYNDQILQINLIEENKIYVINFHNSTQKIWYSSPFTGAKYFIYQNNDWVDQKSKLKLTEILFKELEENSNLKFN